MAANDLQNKFAFCRSVEAGFGTIIQSGFGGGVIIAAGEADCLRLSIALTIPQRSVPTPSLETFSQMNVAFSLLIIASAECLAS